MNDLRWIQSSTCFHKQISDGQSFKPTKLNVNEPNLKIPNKNFIGKQDRYPYIETIQKIMHAAGDSSQPQLEQTLLLHQVINAISESVFNLELLEQIQKIDQQRILKNYLKTIFKKQEDCFNHFSHLKNSVISEMQGTNIAQDIAIKKQDVKKSLFNVKRIDSMDNVAYHYFVKCRSTNFLSQGIQIFKKFLRYDQWKHFFRFQRVYKFFQFVSFCYVKVLQEIIEQSIDINTQTLDLKVLKLNCLKVQERYVKRTQKFQKKYKLRVQAYQLFIQEYQQFQSLFNNQIVKKIKLSKNIEDQVQIMQPKSSDQDEIHRIWQDLDYYQIYWKNRIIAENQIINNMQNQQYKPKNKYCKYLKQQIEFEQNLTTLFFKWLLSETSFDALTQKLF